VFVPAAELQPTDRHSGLRPISAFHVKLFVSGRFGVAYEDRHPADVLAHQAAGLTISASAREALAIIDARP